jgi:hypothetical protein
MCIRSSVVALIIFSLFAGECGSKSSPPDFAFIDQYLATWDRFAQGANGDTPRFQQHLAEALKQSDRRAPSRLVFYAVVQVGGFIVDDSDLGRACERLVGREVPISTSKKGERLYFAGDLYFWWQRHRSEYEALRTRWIVAI